MDVTKLVYAIIGITVGVIVVATVLLPEIAEVTKEGGAAEDYATLLTVVGTLTIIASGSWAEPRTDVKPQAPPGA